MRRADFARLGGASPSDRRSRIAAARGRETGSPRSSDSAAASVPGRRSRRLPRAHRRPWKRDRRTVEQDLAGVRRVDAGEQFHQCRFAGAVLAGNRMNGAGVSDEGDVRQRPDRAEALRDVAELDRRRAASAVEPSPAVGEDRHRRRRASGQRLNVFLDHVLRQGRGEPEGVVEVGPVIFVEIRMRDRLRVGKIGLVQLLAFQQRRRRPAPSPAPRPGVKIGPTLSAPAAFHARRKPLLASPVIGHQRLAESP